MKNQKKVLLLLQPISALLIFIIFTICTKLIDVSPVGPQNSEIGFSTFNVWWHELTGEITIWYEITDIIGKFSFLVIGAFAVLGAFQLFSRRSFKKVDTDIYILGAFYILVLAFYCLFEVLIINYRPVLMDGVLEASYPSSHTMMIICVMSSARTVLSRRVKNKTLMSIISAITGILTVVMVFGRLICGVHWFTDIIGGILLSVFLLMLYDFGNNLLLKDTNT